MPLCLYLTMVVACSPEKQQLEINSKQIQAKGVKAYQPQIIDKDFVESCSAVKNDATIYQFQLQAKTSYELQYSSTSLTCERGSTLDARLFILDAQNKTIANTETDERKQASLKITPEVSGPYYLAIVPKYKDKTGSYAVRLERID